MAWTNNSDGNKNVSGLNESEYETYEYNLHELNKSYGLLARNIYISILSVLLFFGILGNVLSLIVWNKGPRCKVLSCALYFKILAISDIFVLISYTSIRFFRKSVHIEIVIDLIGNHCALYSVIKMLEALGPQISPWIIVTLSVERTISILCPLKCSWKPSKKRAWISFGCIIIILIILYCLWMLRIENSEIIFIHCYDRDRDFFDMIMMEILDNDFNITGTLNTWVLAILPFIFIMVCNIMILIQMFQMRKLKAVTGRGRRTEVFATFTIITVVTGLLHCVSVIPLMLLYIAWNQWFENEDGYNFLHLLQGHVSNDVFWEYFPRATIMLNNSLNFYVYCLVGRDFRKDVRQTLTCCSTRNNTRVQVV